MFQIFHKRKNIFGRRDAGLWLRLVFVSAPAMALCLAFIVTPANAADDLYIYSGGGGGGGSGNYHGGGGGGGYMGTSADGAGKGGDGGDWYSGGAGGGSGGASLDGDDSSTMQGGAGGGSGVYAGGDGAMLSSGTGGVGGDGGSVIDPTVSDTEFNAITLGAGSGGHGGTNSFGNGGKGGDGGNIHLTLNADTSVSGGITLTAGNGGNGVFGISTNYIGGDGGNGGSISLAASGNLTANGGITLTSGNNGAVGHIYSGQGGAGGGVYFGYSDAGITASIYTLVFADNSGAGHTVSLTNNGGEAKFHASGLTLEAGTSGAANTVSFAGVSGYDALSLGDLTLKGYSVIEFDDDVSASIDDVYISGINNTINNNNATLTVQIGKAVNFDLTGLTSADNGAVMLTAGGSGTVDITSATTVNTNNFDYSAFGLGEGITLVRKVTGTFATTPPVLQSVNADLDVEYTTLKTTADALATYISTTIHKNTTVTATGDISVSPGSYGPVTDIYEAGLDMSDNTLSVASNANGTATFEVAGGDLVASTVNLTQNTNDLTFTIADLDVTANDTAFILNGTTAAKVTVNIAKLDNGRTLSIDNTAGDMNIATLNVTGSGNTLAVATSAQAITTLNVNSAGIIFVAPAGLSAGDTVVTTTNANLDNAVIDIDISGGVSLTQGQTFNLVSTTGSLSATGINSTIDKGRYSFDLTTSGSNLIAEFSGLLTFGQVTDNAFAGTSWHNVNLVSGAAHLDWLDTQSVDPALWEKIGDAFDENLALGGARASAGLQQVYGAYSAYANNALSADADRFRRRWQIWNRNFFDIHLFRDAFTTVTGIASDRANASPVYGPCDTISCGQSRVWAGGFGAWAKQNQRNNLSGYKYDSQGAVLGYEYSLGSLNLGFAAAYSRGDLKVNDLRYKNEADVVNLALYGSYIHESGVYAEGGFGYGHAWNDYKVHSLAHPGGVKKGKYGSDAFTADLELGYIARLPQDFNLIPSVGIEYSYLRNGSWAEGVNNAALIANRFDSGHDNGVDIPLGLRFNKMFRFGSGGGFVAPEVRAAYVYSANENRPSITSGFADTPGGAEMVGVDPGRSHWRVGAGLSGRLGSRVDFRVDYDFETRSGYKGHNLNATVGLSF